MSPDFSPNRHSFGERIESNPQDAKVLRDNSRDIYVSKTGSITLKKKTKHDISYTL